MGLEAMETSRNEFFFRVPAPYTIFYVYKMDQPQIKLLYTYHGKFTFYLLSVSLYCAIPRVPLRQSRRRETVGEGEEIITHGSLTELFQMLGQTILSNQ